MGPETVWLLILF